MKHSNQSQEAQILKHLQRGKKLTALDALSKFNCWRLASRVSDLNKDGHNIKCTMIVTKTNKRIGQYSISK